MAEEILGIETGFFADKKSVEDNSQASEVILIEVIKEEPEEINGDVLETKKDHQYSDSEDYLLQQQATTSNEDSSLEDVKIVRPIKTIELWDDFSTKILLNKYYKYLDNIGPLKEFKNKRSMWMKIGKEVGKSWKQCEQRFKTILKRKKKGQTVIHNRKIVSKRKPIGFEEELRKIRNKKTPSIRETMLEIFEIKENNRERRHREKMEKCDKIENLLMKFLKNKS